MDRAGGPERGTFDPRPYRARGGITVRGLLVALAWLVAGGVLFGWLGHRLGRWWHVPVLIYAAVGLGVAVFVYVGLSAGRVRNRWAAGAVVLLGCATGLASSYGFEYLHGLDGAAFSVEGLWEFARGRAEATMRFLSGQRGRRPIDLGAAGPYLWLAVELGVVALTPLVAMFLITGAPACPRCDRWKEARPLGRFDDAPEDARDALARGRLDHFAGRAAPKGPLALTAYVCPACGTGAPADLFLEQVTTDPKYGESTKTLARVSYPGAALPYFEKLLGPHA